MGEYKDVVIRDCHQHTREDGCFLIHYEERRIRGCIQTCNRDYCNHSRPTQLHLLLAWLTIPMLVVLNKFCR